ncbi:MAG: hypothetical protein H6648_10210 [Caldilineae bacterium]|nr:hypothetical protein [Chloroflexota bacterium]MCB9177524.1 hypothetical protein [Caldilineae bacterium]
MTGSEAASAEAVAATLNAICSAAVGAGRSGDRAALAAFCERLDRRADAFRTGDQAPVADFLAALSRLLRGAPLGDAIAGLVEPYRQGLRAVAADLAPPPADGRLAWQNGDRGEPVIPVDAARPVMDAAGHSAPEAAATEDWVAALTAHVAALLKARDRETARALATELERTAGRPGIDPDAAAYLALLLDVLRGQDVRHRILRLVEPYRSAYGSLQLLMRGADPRAALLDRLVHNAELVLTSDNPAAGEALAKVLDALRAEALRSSEPELARFAESIRRLLEARADPNAADASADATPSFQDAALAEAWRRLSAR